MCSSLYYLDEYHSRLGLEKEDLHGFLSTQFLLGLSHLICWRNSFSLDWLGIFKIENVIPYILEIMTGVRRIGELED